MTAEEAQWVREKILASLRVHSALSPAAVIKEVSSGANVPDSDVQQVVRDLVSNSEVEVTSNWDLALLKQG